MNLQPITPNDFRTWCKSRAREAALLLAAMAAAKTTRAQVDAYIAPVFARYTFTDSDTGQPITSPADLYLSDDDEQCARFYADCDRAHAAHGYKLEPGFCPALVAENHVIELENAFIDAGSSLTGITRAQLWKPSLRRQWLELHLKACVSANNLTSTAAVLKAANLTA